MKVKIGPFRDRWVSYIHDKYMDKKYGHYEWEDSTTRFEMMLEKLEDAFQWVYNHSINLILDRRPSQKINVRIDKFDTWSMDHTLAPIILPMLIQLKETKHGSPMVDMTDVPQELRVNDPEAKEFWDNGDIDDKHHSRWDWVMGEMIWAFEQKCRDHWEGDYYKYEEDSSATFGLKLVWEDCEGRKAHQERMTNGFRLFGKYYENLWD